MSNDKPLERRAFLRWSAAASVATLAACERSTDPAVGGADAGAAIDSAPADASSCRPTRDDALGPFFEDGAPMRTQIAAVDEPGERLRLTGRVLADDCATPVAKVLIDVWQADKDGNYHDAGVEFRLRGQVLTDDDGRFAVDTIRPGNYELTPGIWRPAHVHFMFTKPGFVPFATQLYFSDDPFLAPNDGCNTCGSDDAERIVELTQTPKNDVWTGQWRVVLAST